MSSYWTVKATCVAAVAPPPLPVIVMVKVPILAFRFTLTVIVELPLPVPPAGLIDLGLKLMATPLSGTDPDREIAEREPLVTVAMIVDEPELPLEMVSDVGDALIVKAGAAEGTVSVTVVVSMMLPEVPVTVMVYVPEAVPDGTFTVMIEVSVPEMDDGLKLAEGPVGDEEPVRTIVPVNPPLGANEMVEVPELPAATVSDDEEALSVKLGVAAPASAPIRLAPLGLPQPVARSYPVVAE